MHIENTRKEGQDSLTVDAIFTSSPEIVVFLPRDKPLPLSLKPGQKLTYTVLLVPETHGAFEGAVYISFA